MVCSPIWKALGKALGLSHGFSKLGIVGQWFSIRVVQHPCAINSGCKVSRMSLNLLKTVNSVIPGRIPGCAVIFKCWSNKGLPLTVLVF